MPSVIGAIAALGVWFVAAGAGSMRPLSEQWWMALVGAAIVGVAVTMLVLEVQA